MRQEREGNAELSNTAKVVKDPLIRKVFLRRGVEGYGKLLENCGVDGQDVERNKGRLVSGIEDPNLSQGKAKRILDLFRKIKIIE